MIDTIQPISEEMAKSAHTEQYIESIKSIYPEGCDKPQIYIKDCYINPESYQTALLSAGGVVKAGEIVSSGQAQNAFALIRPPGHHSGEYHVCSGFCFLNNVGISIRNLQKKYQVKKVAIFDFDIHHGDGTQYIFRKEKDVLYMSFHRYDQGIYFPKTGNPDYIGEDEGRGYSVNVAWNTKIDEKNNLTVTDSDFIFAFEAIAFPILSQFQPEMIFVSAGFDGLRDDPIGKCQLSQEIYAYAMQRLSEIC